MTIIILDREFATNLNKNFTEKIQFDVPEFEGTYADLLILVIYRLIQNGPRILQTLYKSLISVISNVAPYVKGLCSKSCEAILYLIKIFSAPSYLAEKEDNCKVLTSLMEAVNYLLVYQDGSNGRLLITLVNNKEMLLGLESIETFSSQTQYEEESKQKVLDEEDKREEEQKEGEEQKQQMVEVQHEPAQLSEGTNKEESKELKEEEGSKEEDALKELAEEDDQWSGATEQPIESLESSEKEKPDTSAEVKSEDLQSTTNESSAPEKALTDDKKRTDEGEKKVDENEEQKQAVKPASKEDAEEKKKSSNIEETKGEEARFPSREWIAEWKKSLNLENVKQAIKQVDQRAVQFLKKNPNKDNNIDGDKVY